MRQWFIDYYNKRVVQVTCNVQCLLIQWLRLHQEISRWSNHLKQMF